MKIKQMKTISRRKQLVGFVSLLLLTITTSCIDFSTIFDDKDDDTPKSGKLPEVETVEVKDISATRAIGTIKIIDNGGIDLTGSGVCVGKTNNPTTTDQVFYGNSSNGTYSVELNELEPNTTYYARAFATNNEGTAYGNSIKFETPQQKIEYGENVKDIDGNEYKTVIIGTQTWMVENLKVTKYNDGTPIETTTIDVEWSKLSDGGYCWYNNDESKNKNPYGAIYNWYAVNTGKLCPKGWHVPNNEEWEVLLNYLGNYIAGEKLKITGTEYWEKGSYANNETGFSGVGAGSRNFFGTYDGLGKYCSFWSSTVTTDSNAYYWNLSDNHAGLTFATFNKATGYSVRCIKD